MADRLESEQLPPEDNFQALEIKQRVNLTPEMLELLQTSIDSYLRTNPNLIPSVVLKLLASDDNFQNQLADLILPKCQERLGKLQATDLGNVEKEAINLFSDIKYLEYIVIRPLHEAVSIAFVHSNVDRVQALSEIQDRLMKLEDLFDGIDFDPLILHVSDRPEELTGRKIKFRH